MKTITIDLTKKEADYVWALLQDRRGKMLTSDTLTQKRKFKNADFVKTIMDKIKQS